MPKKVFSSPCCVTYLAGKLGPFYQLDVRLAAAISGIRTDKNVVLKYTYVLYIFVISYFLILPGPLKKLKGPWGLLILTSKQQQLIVLRRGYCVIFIPNLDVRVPVSDVRLAAVVEVVVVVVVVR